MFLLHGLIVGTWVSRIPAVQMQLGLTNGVLGATLLTPALGAVLMSASTVIVAINGLLRQTPDTVHATWNDHGVPMNGGGRLEIVGHVNPQSIAFQACYLYHIHNIQCI